MPTPREILEELESRRDQLSPEQILELDELASRLEVSGTPTSPAPGEIPTIGPREMSLGGFLENIPKSASRLVGDIGQAVTHPIETLKGLGKAISSPEDLMFFAKARYGSLDNALWTMYSDPVGFASDVSMFAGASGVALKAGGLPRVGSAVGAAGRAADPVLATAKLAKMVAKRPLRLGLEFTGAGMGAATGTGTEAVRIAVTKNTKGFREAMRGIITEADIGAEVRTAAHNLKQRRGTAYRSELSKIKKSKGKVDISPLREHVDSLLEDFRVGRKADGSLDFSESAIGSQGQKHISEVVKLVDNWRDSSVAGVDALKRRIGDFWTESGQARAFIAASQKEARKLLEGIPEYKKLTKDYAVASEFLELIETELSLNQQPGALIRKLSSAINQNSKYRQLILEALDEASGTDITGKVTGASFSSIAPRGIMRPLAGGSIIYTVSTGNLESLPALLLTSPRGTGELLTALAAVRRGLASVGRKVPGYPGAVAYRPFLLDVEQPEEDALEP